MTPPARLFTAYSHEVRRRLLLDLLQLHVYSNAANDTDYEFEGNRLKFHCHSGCQVAVNRDLVDVCSVKGSALLLSIASHRT